MEGEPDDQAEGSVEEKAMLPDIPLFEDPVPVELEQYFFKELKLGRVPSVASLRAKANSLKAKVPTKVLRTFHWRYSHLARLRASPRRPRKNATLVLERYGVVFIDQGFVYQKWAKPFNRGYDSFICAVEALSQQVALFPMRSKKLSAWKDAIKQVLDESVMDTVDRLVSDREPSIISQKFRTMLRDERSIEVVFLEKKSKAYLAENMIRWTKNALSKIMAERKRQDDPNYRTWYKDLPEVARSFNAKYLRGTRYRRRDITRSNVQDFLAAWWGVRDPSLLFNLPVLDTDWFGNSRYVDSIFPLSIGDKVMVARKALAGHDKLSTFTKTSVEGGYGRKVYTVVKRILMRTLEQSLVPGKKIAKKRGNLSCTLLR